MSEFRGAIRYAKALIDLSVEQKSLEQIHGDMKDFLAVLKKNPALEATLKSPVIIGEKKFAVLKLIFGKSMHANSIAFFQIIIRKNRGMFLKAIAEAFIVQYNLIKNIARAEIKTAVALDEKTYAEVQDFIAKSTGKNIELKTTVQPELIGGIVVKMEDRLFDASIKGKLQQLKQELLNTYISK
jgi:F-type H+-transporting ATPase subunit delta